MDKTKYVEGYEFPVSVERLDSILDASSINNIRLIKLDVQGFECNAIDGMGALIEKVQILKFEYEQQLLWNHMCMNLVEKMKSTGMRVFKADMISEVHLDPNVILPGIELYASRETINIDGGTVTPFHEGQWKRRA